MDSTQPPGRLPVEHVTGSYPSADLPQNPSASDSMPAEASEPVIQARLAKPVVVVRPRWWTPLAVLAFTLGVFIVISSFVTIAAFFVAHGQFTPAMLSDESAFHEVFRSRGGIVMIVLVPQCVMIVPALLAAFLSPVETRRRLSLVRGHWPLAVWVAAAVATPLIGLVSSVFVGLFFEDSENLRMMSEAFRFHGQSGFLIPVALLIGATPAICEELVFRGYVQTRLVGSWGPGWGIFLSSFLFAAFHMDFVHIVAVFPIGVYLGWIAWRSGSLFPAMMAHFVNNVVSVIAVVIAPEENVEVLGLPTIAMSLSILGFGIIGLATVVAASIYYGKPMTDPESEPFQIERNGQLELESF